LNSHVAISEYPIHHVVQPISDLLVRNPQNLQRPRGQYRVSFPVRFHLLAVDRSVDLDHQSRRVTIEIDDEPVDHLLTAEMVSAELIPPQSQP
jgi:hypothetical protein